MKKRVITTTLAAGFILVFVAEAHADTINGHHVTRLSESRAVDDTGDRWSKDGNVWFNDETREYGKIVSDSLESLQDSSYYPEIKETDSDKPNEVVQIQVQDEGISVHQQTLTTAGSTESKSNQTNDSTIESQTGMTVGSTVEQPTTDPTLGTTTIKKEAVPTKTEATQLEEDTRMTGTTETRSNQTNESTIESQTGMTVEATVEQPTTTDPTLGTTTIKKGAVPTKTEATKPEKDTRIAETSGKGSNRTNGSTSKEKTKKDVVAEPVSFLSSAEKSVPMRAIKKDTAFSNILSKNNGHTFPKTGESTLFSNILQAVGFLVISVLGVVSIRVKKTKN
ncbi:hypothetical protein AB1I55_10135 [Enterococcus entomosocium]|uniref:Gram-positive cocci surface proteins LPxTG domain-containing protein n=1 Tax=Enterococcus entomosocium TaxID=3034352 RepID=A0ABV3MDE6_9ENTE|nr:hypothetical protein [Enterococcus casseliflavus]MDB1710588.1 hypothetical protein [Enterococcus casseliflavus]MDB1717800.1 hypothetical protein [Enterococcus casseliflavus]